jgi:hypothetical protein
MQPVGPVPGVSQGYYLIDNNYQLYVDAYGSGYIMPVLNSRGSVPQQGAAAPSSSSSASPSSSAFPSGLSNVFNGIVNAVGQQIQNQIARSSTPPTGSSPYSPSNFSYPNSSYNPPYPPPYNAPYNYPAPVNNAFLQAGGMYNNAREENLYINPEFDRPALEKPKGAPDQYWQGNNSAFPNSQQNFPPNASPPNFASQQYIPRH